MFETLFGSELPLPARFFIAFLAVLALIALTAWLVRRFGANRLGSSARGRQPRLAVIDAASVDGRRRLVLVRRDNVEHLLMIGGPTDVVVEPNIVRASSRDTNRETVRAAAASDGPPRAVPLSDAGSWPLQPVHEPPPSRPARPAAVDEPWIPASEPGLRARPADSSGGQSAEPPSKAHTEFTPSTRPAPLLPPTPTRETAHETATPPQTDHNLAEMAQRLEAALRRPAATDVHPAVTDPLAVPVAAPVAKPEAARTFARESAVPEPPRVATREPAPPEIPRVATREAKPRQPESRSAPAGEKNPFDSLEQEMASLLGRPSGKT